MTVAGAIGHHVMIMEFNNAMSRPDHVQNHHHLTVELIVLENQFGIVAVRAFINIKLTLYDPMLLA